MDGDEIRALAEQHVQFLHHEGKIAADGGFIWSPDQRKLDDYLVGDNDAFVSLDEIADAESRISHWRRAYPRRVEAQKLKQVDADRELALMSAIVDDYAAAVAAAEPMLKMGLVRWRTEWPGDRPLIRFDARTSIAGQAQQRLVELQL